MFSRIFLTALFFLALLEVFLACTHFHGRSEQRNGEVSSQPRDHVTKHNETNKTKHSHKNESKNESTKINISFPKSYHATGFLTLPYDGIMEDFEIWYAEDVHMSRIDYYHGVDKTYQRGDMEEYGVFIKEIPIHRTKVGKNNKHGTLCWFKTGNEDDVVEPQGVVPLDLSHYKEIGEEYRSGTLAIKLRRHLTTGNLNNTFTLWVTKSKPHLPLRYETEGFDLLLSGYYDHYFLDYVTFAEWEFDFEIMRIPTESWCHYAARKTKSRYHVNPMSEFVHHPYHIPKHHKLLEKNFKKFKRKHNKVYKDEKEHTKRRNIYKHNARFIRSKNRARLNYTLALNQLADLSPEEFSLMNDLLDQPDEGMNSLHDQFPKRGEVPTVSCCYYPPQPPPENLDWREYDILSPIRGQSMCGSCWAFSTVGMLEGAYKIATGKDIQLSAQMLVDCTYGYNNYGCRGGWPWKAMKWVIKNGIATKDSYGRYLAQEGLCHCGPKENCTIIHPQSFGDIVSANKTAMRINVAKYGPVSVGINSSPKSFKFYRSGIYDDMDCDDQTEHSVLLVGYGKDHDDYGHWVIKNSWGPYWGRQGYMRIANNDDVCGILSSNGLVANFRNDSTGYPFESMRKVTTPHKGDIDDHIEHNGFKPIFSAIPFH